MSAERAGFLRFAVEMLDTSRDMLKNLAEKPSLADTKVSRVGVPDQSLTHHRAPSNSSYQTQRPSGSQIYGLSQSNSSSVTGSSIYGRMDADPGEPMDMEMEEVQSSGRTIGPSSLSRVTSTSAFSGFSNETEMYENGQRSPGTPPSSVG